MPKKFLAETDRYYIPALILIIVFAYFKVTSFYFRYDTFVWLDKTMFDPVNWDYFFSYNKASPVFTPLGNLLFLVFYKLFALNASWYHLMLLLLHIGNALLAYRLVREVTHNAIGAFLASVLFGISPPTSEPTVYIAAFHHALATFFVIFTFLAFVRFKELSKPTYYRLSILFYVLALATKQPAIMAPMLLLGYDYLLAKRLPWKQNLKQYIPFLIISTVYVTINYAVGQSNTAYVPILTKYYGIGSHLLANLINYLRYMAFPFDPIATHLGTIFKTSLDKAYPSIQTVVFILFLIVAISFVVKSKEVRFFFFWCVVALMPTLPFKFTPQSRYMYLAAVGFYSAVAIILTDNRLVHKTTYRPFVWGIMIALFLAGQVTLYRYEADYESWRSWVVDIKMHCQNLPKGTRLYLIDFPQLAISRDDEIQAVARVALGDPALEVKAVSAKEVKELNRQDNTHFLQYKDKRFTRVE